MSALLLILLSSVLVSYFAIHNVQPLQPFYSDDAHDSALGVAVVIAMNVAVLAPLCWLLDQYVLRALHVEYLAAVLFVSVMLMQTLVSARLLELHGRWLPHRPGFLLMMTAQSVLLGVPLLGRVRSGNILEALALGIGAGGSFAVLLLAFSSMQVRLRAANVPAPFRQAPISLITLGIMALAVMGFTGLIRGIALIAIVVMAATGVLLAMTLLKLHSYKAAHPPLDNESSPDESLIEQIDALLPQTQCRRCTFDGCRPYATALARNEADINQCPPGGHDTAVALAKLLGRPPKPVDATFGIVRAAPLVAWIDEPACIGCAKCILACPVDAIVGAPKYMHTVIAAQCTGCELCVAPCPVDCIEMREVGAPAHDEDTMRLRAS